VNHPNRSKLHRSPAANPTPAQIREARERAGLTQAEAAKKVYATPRAWQNWESEDPTESRRMHPAIFELFLLKVGQLSAEQVLGNLPRKST
jgi:DNA-binding XRE family transcriptional regulator